MKRSISFRARTLNSAFVAVVALSAVISIPTSVRQASGLSSTRLSATPWINAALLSWRLAAPISRATVLGENGKILIAGGLGYGGLSEGGVFSLNPKNGSLTLISTLQQPVHDAAGAMISGRLFVFGGGVNRSLATVQAVSKRARGGTVGRLPAPRSDLVSAVSGKQVYLIGGYNGTDLATAILRTGDGRTSGSSDDWESQSVTLPRLLTAQSSSCSGAKVRAGRLRRSR